jgi:hypothetical protein
LGESGFFNEPPPSRPASGQQSQFAELHRMRLMG